MILTSLSIIADSHFYRDSQGWHSYDEKTDTWRDIFSTKNISDPWYWERNYPYQKKSDLTSFKTADPTYIDQTNRDMGNR